MRVLGIETSCDETGVAIYDDKQGLIADKLYSQVKLHQQFGGVVPELASRDHIRKLTPLVKSVLQQADSTAADIDGIAYTAGPGLVGALLVGACFARSLAFAWEIPSIGIHHMEAHLLAVMLEDPAPQFPFVALLVSGGHTMLIQANAPGNYQVIGQTLDDAAGEAFDKIAKLLDLGYPGGPAIAKAAEQGTADRFHLPRPMVNRPGLDFSFSGLKTHCLTTWQQTPQDQQSRHDLALAFEQAMVDTLVIKCLRALSQQHIARLVVAGGVGANLRLRQKLRQQCDKKNVEVYFPRQAYCTDNGAMVAYTGLQHLQQGRFDDLAIQVFPRWDI